MSGRAYGRCLGETAKCDVNVLAIADHRKQERPACLAASVVVIRTSEDEQVLAAFLKVQLTSLNAGKGLEG